jgi:hypothetical protein
VYLGAPHNQRVLAVSDAHNQLGLSDKLWTLTLQHVLPMRCAAGVHKCGKLADNFCFSAPFIGPLNAKVRGKSAAGSIRLYITLVIGCTICHNACRWKLLALAACSAAHSAGKHNIGLAQALRASPTAATQLSGSFQFKAAAACGSFLLLCL